MLPASLKPTKDSAHDDNRSEWSVKIDDVIADASAGKLFILVDDEDRENEGDLCIVAEYATPDAINFMAKHGRGLICLALTRQRTETLGLAMMERRNESRHETAFTVSIEAREGVTTGISAADRAHTIQTAINPQCGERDVTTPGHIFPLVARDGGTLVRAGHTEAVVDIARACGVVDPAGVICEIMKDDGEMARLPDLWQFAREHGLKIASIADLIAWRRRNESLVQRTVETTISTRVGGNWRVMIYVNTTSKTEHIVLIKGDISDGAPVLVRMHALDLMADLLGEVSENEQVTNCHRDGCDCDGRARGGCGIAGVRAHRTCQQRSAKSWPSPMTRPMVANCVTTG